MLQFMGSQRVGYNIATEQQTKLAMESQLEFMTSLTFHHTFCIPWPSLSNSVVCALLPGGVTQTFIPEDVGGWYSCWVELLQFFHWH